MTCIKIPNDIKDLNEKAAYEEGYWQGYKDCKKEFLELANKILDSKEPQA